MKVLSVLCLLAVAFVAAALADKDVVEGEYIILLKPGMLEPVFQQHIKMLKANFSNEAGNEVLASWSIGPDYKAIHAKLTPRMLVREMVHDEVLLVEPNRMMYAWEADTEKVDCNIQQDAIWNLARVDEREINLVDSEYNYDKVAADVDVYVIDTGVQITHNEFAGRATWGTNTADTTNSDCNGHGTHVAGTIAGNLYGIAKKANLIAVKVLGCSGSGTLAGVANGVAWAAANAQKTGRRSVGNMSLGGGRSAVIDNAVDAAVAQGFVMIVAAGNSNTDACNFSPAGCKSAVSVASTQLVQLPGGLQADRRSSFSNYGTCVAIYAPGSLIKAAWIGASNNDVNTISGTSMASPHVCGVAALLMSNQSLSPGQVTAALQSGSTKNVVDMACGTSAVCNNTPNQFLYTACAGQQA